MWFDSIASMRRHGGLRSPLQERLFLLFGEACRVIEQCVISGRHRTSAHGVFDTLQRCKSLLRIVSLPIGKIQHTTRGVGGEMGRRNSRIPRNAFPGRMALITGALKDRSACRGTRRVCAVFSRGTSEFRDRDKMRESPRHGSNSAVSGAARDANWAQHARISGKPRGESLELKTVWRREVDSNYLCVANY